MALGKRAWRWGKGAWRGAMLKEARGNTGHTGLSPYQVLTVNISSLERKLVYTLLETQDRGICREYGTIWEYDPPGGK